MESKLKELYQDPEIGLSSKNNFFNKAKQYIPNLKLKDVDNFLKSLSVSQITKPINTKDREYNTIKSFGVSNNYQIDLFNLPYSSKNKNYKYLLTCIDVYSRYVQVIPIRTKTGPVVLDAFKKIINEMGICKNLNCDEGAEFVYKPFLNYCEEKDITVWMSNPEQENKNSIIERFHRTLRIIILRYCLVKGTTYINDLHKIIMNYNSNKHSSINARPIDVWKGNAQPEQYINNVEINFKVGDRVRHINKKRTFDKSSSSTNYTAKVYTITKIEGNSIYLDELKKPFRNYELIKAVEDNNENTDKYVINDENERRNNKIQRARIRSGIFS
jgi:hypothetical protein